MSNEPKPISEDLTRLLTMSEGFKKAQEKYMGKFDSKGPVTDHEKEYYRSLFVVKDELPKLTEEQARNVFWHCAREMNPDYQVVENMKPVYRALVNHFFGYASEFNPEKSTLILGGTGCGKTQFMRIMQKALQYTGKTFRFFPCIDVEQEIRFGGEYNTYDTGNICFDDLGAEQLETLCYGNRVVVMTEIIQRRYNRFQNQGLKTYFTSNLLPEEIEQRYGNRVMDRLKEMCNIVIFSWDSFRK